MDSVLDTSEKDTGFDIGGVIVLWKYNGLMDSTGDGAHRGHSLISPHPPHNPPPQETGTLILDRTSRLSITRSHAGGKHRLPVIHHRSPRICTPTADFFPESPPPLYASPPPPHPPPLSSRMRLSPRHLSDVSALLLRAVPPGCTRLQPGCCLLLEAYAGSIRQDVREDHGQLPP